MPDDIRITVPADVAARIDERVASGAASDAADVVRAGLAALEADDRRKLDAMREKIAGALSDPRPSVSADDAFDRTEKLLAALKAR